MDMMKSPWLELVYFLVGRKRNAEEDAATTRVTAKKNKPDKDDDTQTYKGKEKNDSGHNSDHSVKRSDSTLTDQAPSTTINPTRLTSFANYADEESATFSPTRLPPNATWGNKQMSFLCMPNNDPIIIWLVGEVQAYWFFDNSGRPQSQVNISIQPLHSADVPILQQFLKDKSEPLQDFPSNIFYASRFQTEKARGEYIATAVPFTNVFDAKEKFKPKNQMKRLSAPEITMNDIVLVEAHIRRFKTTSSSGDRTGWKAWRTKFELLAVSQLLAVPTNEDRGNATSLPTLKYGEM
ncbi:hypothetical protein BKA93DRAFT_753694 [Sparassis latifolia]